MDREINVVIVEDDPFARNWMTLIIARDWRTKVVGDYDRPAMLPVFYKENPALKCDIVVVDTETPLGGDWVRDTVEAITKSNRTTRVLCTGVAVNNRLLQKLTDPIFVGYVLKGEIPYSLAWAIHLCGQGNWVTTPNVDLLASNIGFSPPYPSVVLDGIQSPFKFHDKRKDFETRLAILYSMERHELANELGIQEEWGYGKISQYYKEMGLKDILAGESDQEDILKGQNMILSYLEEMKEDYSEDGKSRWMETMAFHLLTMPKITPPRS